MVIVTLSLTINLLKTDPKFDRGVILTQDFIVDGEAGTPEFLEAVQNLKEQFLIDHAGATAEYKK